METIQHDGYTIEIESDQDIRSPRKEYDNMGTLVAFHKRYDLGDGEDKHSYDRADFSAWDELLAAIERDHAPAVILPVYLYDHSGQAVSTQPFHCPWDSGQVGFIFASKAKVRENFGVKRLGKATLAKARECLAGEVAVLNQYLGGDVWCYSVKDEAGEDVDSCCGMYGRDYCEKEAHEAAAAHNSRRAGKLAAKAG